MSRLNYPDAILANFNNDYKAAYEHLAKAYLILEQRNVEEGASRFIEISRFEPDSEVCIRKITEKQISSAVNMADCEDPGVLRTWLYVDDAGALQPVTIGKQERFSDGVEQLFHYASSDIVAGGKTVGQVVYTDH